MIWSDLLFTQTKSYPSSLVREDLIKLHFSYIKLADLKSFRASEVSGGAERQVPLHKYIFDVLKAVHKQVN